MLDFKKFGTKVWKFSIPTLPLITWDHNHNQAHEYLDNIPPKNYSDMDSSKSNLPKLSGTTRDVLRILVPMLNLFMTKK